MPAARSSSRSSSLALLGDDSALLAQLRRGDGAAFNAIVEAHYRPLVAYATLDAGSLEDAEEVVQDVLVALWEGRARLTITTSLRQYLYGAVHNRALGARVRNQRIDRLRERLQAAVGDDATVAEDAAVAAEQALEAVELEMEIRRAIDQLPRRARATMRLRWERQLSYPEIAKELGLSVKTVETRIGRALAQLRRILRHT